MNEDVDMEVVTILDSENGTHTTLQSTPSSACWWWWMVVQYNYDQKDDNHNYFHTHTHTTGYESPIPVGLCWPLSVFVIRVVDAAVAHLDATNEHLKDDICIDDFSSTTGYVACSHNQVILEPAVHQSWNDTRISEGITILFLKQNVTATVGDVWI